jgi:ATP-binding cassette subfamily B (MDR/TAP) protein 1
LEQLDVKTAFLHGDLEEDIYMTQPEGFEVPGKENLVCKLHKSLYGLKQASGQWDKKFYEFISNSGFSRCNMDHCCYVKKYGNYYVIIGMCIDDMLIAGSSMTEMNRLKQQLTENFEMKDLGPAKQILGLRISRNKSEGTLKLSQEKYILKLLDRFYLGDAKTRNTPLESHLKFSKKQSPKKDEEKWYMSRVPYASAVENLIYAMVCTRPDIAHAVGVVSQFESKPGKEHWEGVQWIPRYLKSTSGMCLWFRRSNLTLQRFSDLDLGGDLDTRKSTIGYIFTLGGTVVSWKSKLQRRVALSTTEVEYIAISKAAKEMIWLHNFLSELGKE